MTSFYLSLNSDGGKDVHPNNHGGDFTIELHDVMDLRGDWEVALVEMSYFGQHFGNVPHEHSRIQISSSKADAYPTQFVAHYHGIEDLYIKTYVWREYNAFDKGYRERNIIWLRKKHYTWHSLKKEINTLGARFKENYHYNSVQHAYFYFTSENVMRIECISTMYHFQVRFSKALQTLLGMERIILKWMFQQMIMTLKKKQ